MRAARHPWREQFTFLMPKSTGIRKQHGPVLLSVAIPETGGQTRILGYYPYSRFPAVIGNDGFPDGFSVKTVWPFSFG
jgi:hypothetical protein